MRQRILSIVPLLASCAAVLGAATPAAAGTTCQNLWCRSAAGWSDGGFGSSYSLWTGIETKKDHPTDPAYDAAYLKLGGDLSVSATAFDKNLTVAEVQALGQNQKGVSSVGYELAAVGVVLYAGQMSNTLTVGFSRPFFEANDSINVSGIKIKLSAKVAGDLALSASPSFFANGVAVTATPAAAAYADVDASVGAACAKVGVSGSMTALDLSVPVTATARLSGTSSLTFGIDGRYALDSLNGSLKVKVNYCAGSASKTLFKFDGFSTSGTFINTSGTLAL